MKNPFSTEDDVAKLEKRISAREESRDKDRSEGENLKRQAAALSADDGPPEKVKALFDRADALLKDADRSETELAELRARRDAAKEKLLESKLQVIADGNAQAKIERKRLEYEFDVAIANAYVAFLNLGDEDSDILPNRDWRGAFRVVATKIIGIANGRDSDEAESLVRGKNVYEACKNAATRRAAKAERDTMKRQLEAE